MSWAAIPPEVLSVLPGCEGGRLPIGMRALPGGRDCNDVRRIDTAAGSFVLRQRHRPVDRPGSRSLDELAAQRLAAHVGLAPRILAAASDGRWLLMEFIEGTLWTEERLLAGDGIELLGQRLGRLHALGVPAGLVDMDASAVARDYLQQIAQRNPGQALALAGEVQRIEEHSRAVANLSGRRSINHGDLQVSNMIGVGPLLVDWEYAQCTDPTYDIACLLTYYPRLEAQMELLLGAAGLGTPADLAVLVLQRELFAGLNSLWGHANGIETG